MPLTPFGYRGIPCSFDVGGSSLCRGSFVLSCSSSSSLLAVPAATAKAVARMPVGFFDDPSFRWSQRHRRRTSPPRSGERLDHPHPRQLGVDRADEAGEPAERERPGLPPLRHRRARALGAASTASQVLLTIARTPKWANGGKTPNYPPTNMNDLTQFAQMLATRYNGTKAGRRRVTPLLGLERAEPRSSS